MLFSFFFFFCTVLPLTFRKLNIHFRTQQNFSFDRIVTLDCDLEMYIKARYSQRAGMIMIQNKHFTEKLVTEKF